MRFIFFKNETYIYFLFFCFRIEYFQKLSKIEIRVERNQQQQQKQKKNRRHLNAYKQISIPKTKKSSIKFFSYGTKLRTNP